MLESHGERCVASESLAKNVEKFVCKLFGATATTLTKARVELFKQGKFAESSPFANSRLF